MNICKKCGEKFESTKGLINYCSLQCRNSRNWSEEDKLKRSQSLLDFNKKNGTLKKIVIRIKPTDEEIIIAANNNVIMQQAAYSLGIKLETFAKRAKKLGVYNPNPQRKGLLKYDHEYKISHEDILSGNNKLSSYNLKNRLLNLKIKEYKCEICNLNEWQEKTITLELHHMDGNRYNNKLDNLQILCPNCHSQTHTYRRSNKRVYKKEEKN